MPNKRRHRTGNGCPLRVPQRYKGASLNASCAGRFGSTEIAQVPGVGYEDIVSDEKVALAKKLERIILANRGMCDTMWSGVFQLNGAVLERQRCMSSSKS